MQDNLEKIGARVYLYEKDALIKKITYIYADGTGSEPLPEQFISVCLQTLSCSERNVRSDFLSIIFCNLRYIFIGL